MDKKEEYINEKNILPLLDALWECQNAGMAKQAEFSDTFIYLWVETFKNRTYGQLREALLDFVANDRYGKFPTPGQFKIYVDRIPKTAEQVHRELGITEEMIKNATPAIIE